MGLLGAGARPRDGGAVPRSYVASLGTHPPAQLRRDGAWTEPLLGCSRPLGLTMFAWHSTREPAICSVSSTCRSAGNTIGNPLSVVRAAKALVAPSQHGRLASPQLFAPQADRVWPVSRGRGRSYLGRPAWSMPCVFWQPVFLLVVLPIWSDGRSREFASRPDRTIPMIAAWVLRSELATAATGPHARSSRSPRSRSSTQPPAHGMASQVPSTTGDYIFAGQTDWKVERGLHGSLTAATSPKRLPAGCDYVRGAPRANRGDAGRMRTEDLSIRRESGCREPCA